MEAAQKVALEPLASALGVAAFVHNVIIAYSDETVHPIPGQTEQLFL